MADEQGGVTVVGVGTVRVPTTEALVHVRIECREAQPGAAMREAGAVVSAALEVIRHVGVPETDVHTEAVSVSPNRVWAQDTEQIQGYDAQQRLRVRVTDLALLDQLLGQLVDRCGTPLQIEDVSQSGQPTPEAMSRARREAVQDAHEKASDYAEFTDRTLGRADSVIEMGPMQRPPAPRARTMMAAAESMPIAQGEETTTVSVQVHWQFD